MQWYKDSQCFACDTFEDDTAFHAKNGLEFFRRNGATFKRQRHLGGSFRKEHRLHMKSHLKLRSKQSHTIGKTLVKPCMLKTVKLLLGEAGEAKMREISLSSDTIQRHISDMLKDVKDQVRA